MDKKDIYEHLAKIYLDASGKKKRKLKKHQDFNKWAFLGASLVFCLGIAVFVFHPKNKPAPSQFALVLQSSPAKINFNFDPANKEVFKLSLNGLNVGRFRELGFTVKKRNFRDTISLRVEFINSFNEKSEIYVRNISHNWQQQRIKLSNFKNIHDWSQMKALSFIVEQWNTKENNGVVYIDNVELLR